MSNDSDKSVPCPTCRKSVPWNAESKFKPFCSERCRLIDLGAWADEEYKISGREKLMEPPGEGSDLN